MKGLAKDDPSSGLLVLSCTESYTLGLVLDLYPLMALSTAIYHQETRKDVYWLNASLIYASCSTEGGARSINESLIGPKDYQ